MINKILDACAVIAAFCGMFCLACVDSRGLYGFVACFGFMLSIIEFLLIAGFRGLEW